METSTKSKLLRDRDLFTRLLRARPLFLTSILFLIGCIAQYALSFPAIALWLMLLLPLLAAIALRHRRVAAALLTLAILPAGALRFDAAWNALNPFPEQANALLSGRISEEPEFNDKTQRAICVLEELTIDGTAKRGKLRLYLRGDEGLLRDVHLGQYVETKAHIWRADEVTNPGEFNFTNYLRIRGLRNYATAEIETAVSSESSYHAGDLPKLLRNAAGERIDRLFPQNTAIARALVLGDRSELSSEMRANYSRAGVAHLLAISGMHITILAWLITLLLGLRFQRTTAFRLTLALLAAYGLLTGFTPSFTRAILMYATLGTGTIIGIRSDSPTRLGAALLIYLAIRPIAILDTGFVLSFGATAGILLLTSPLKHLPIFESVLQRFSRRNHHHPLFWVFNSILMTMAAQLAILPAVVHYYGAQPIWSLITNLIAAPLTMLAYVLALLAMLLNCTPLAGIADFLFGLLTRFVIKIASLPLAELRIARFPLWLAIICALICLISSDLSRLPCSLRRYLPFVLLLAIPLSNLCAWCTTLGMSVVFLDAGQADCAVIRSEGHVYLVDTGDAYSPAADYLSAMNYVPDAIFLTHPHADHTGGLASILELCAPKRIYLSANWAAYDAMPDLDAALDTAKDTGVEIISLVAGDEIALSEQAVLRVLSPKEGILENLANDDSLILCLEYGDARALFLGDASAEISAGLAGDVDLIKVAHHGGQDGTNTSLLMETTPSVAVISVGRDNSYGHPAQRVLQMLAASGTQIYRTDRCGTITCRIAKDGTLTLRGSITSEVGNGLE